MMTATFWLSVWFALIGAATLWKAYGVQNVTETLLRDIRREMADLKRLQSDVELMLEYESTTDARKASDAHHATACTPYSAAAVVSFISAMWERRRPQEIIICGKNGETPNVRMRPIFNLAGATRISAYLDPHESHTLSWTPNTSAVLHGFEMEGPPEFRVRQIWSQNVPLLNRSFTIGQLAPNGVAELLDTELVAGSKLLVELGPAPGECVECNGRGGRTVITSKGSEWFECCACSGTGSRRDP